MKRNCVNYFSSIKFTLIDLLIVTSIIGILTTLLTPSLAGARDQAKKTVCINNLKQAGIDIFSYASDDDGFLCTNVFINTLAGNPIWGVDSDGDSEYLGEFNGGVSGYLVPYLGDEGLAYNCPGSEHMNDFGDRPQFTSRQGVYTGFSSYQYSVRKIDNNHITGVWDQWLGSAISWTDVNMTPILMDPVKDMSIWGGTWDNTDSVIHGNSGTLPILI